MKNTILTLAAIIITNLSLSAQVIFVLSAADTLELNKGEKLRQTGVFLNEFYPAYNTVSKAGYNIDIATPNGLVATIDQESMDDGYWQNNLTLKKQALAFVKNNHAFNHPLSLEEALNNKTHYIGLIIPGGQGLMVDLKSDEHIPVLLSHFAEAKKPTGLICHAPSLILTIPKESNPYVGFNVNSVSPLEEFVIEKFIMKGKPENRKIAKRLKKISLNYKHKLPKANYAVKDRNLVTSQNPFSSERFNKLYLEALEEYQANNK